MDKDSKRQRKLGNCGTGMLPVVVGGRVELS